MAWESFTLREVFNVKGVYIAILEQKTSKHTPNLLSFFHAMQIFCSKHWIVFIFSPEGNKDFGLAIVFVLGVNSVCPGEVFVYEHFSTHLHGEGKVAHKPRRPTPPELIPVSVA